MKKSYWLKKISIANSDLFLEYVRTVLPWLRSVGGIVIKKDISQDSNSSNWDGGNVGMVIEFDSKITAKKAFLAAIFESNSITIPTLPPSQFDELESCVISFLMTIPPTDFNQGSTVRIYSRNKSEFAIEIFFNQ